MCFESMSRRTQILSSIGLIVIVVLMVFTVSVVTEHNADFNATHHEVTETTSYLVTGKDARDSQGMIIKLSDSFYLPMGGTTHYFLYLKDFGEKEVSSSDYAQYVEGDYYNITTTKWMPNTE